MITLEPDMSIEPGHQWIILPADVVGHSLACILLDASMSLVRTDGEKLLIAHTAEVDAQIVALIDELAHVRFSAPGLVQLAMKEATE